MSHQMSVDDFKKKYITPFRDLYYYYSREEGFVVWRMGTGLNVELLHIRAWEPRKGLGTRLLGHMLDRLSADNHSLTPYHSIYGFTRIDNNRARGFYAAMGFNLQTIEGLYKEGRAVFFWQEFAELVRLRGLA